GRDGNAVGEGEEGGKRKSQHHSITAINAASRNPHATRSLGSFYCCDVVMLSCRSLLQHQIIHDHTGEKRQQVAEPQEAEPLVENEVGNLDLPLSGADLEPALAKVAR